jgi:DNA-directed RNA polymerase I subunit RPA2
MLRKLYAIVSKTCSVDNPDSPQHQEVLLPGSLYGMIIKEKLEEALNQVRNQIMQDVRKQETLVDFLNGNEMTSLIAYLCSGTHACFKIDIFIRFWHA